MDILVVFVFYDPLGLVDEYIYQLLSANHIIAKKQCMIVNGTIDDKAVAKIKEKGWADNIIIRPNCGFDGGAYRDFFLHYISKEELLVYDEILLMNDTFYGPLYPWSEVFDVMRDGNYDAWGLTKHSEGIWRPGTYLEGEYMPEHVQGYFWNLTKKVFCSEFFWNFWKNMAIPRTYNEAVVFFEINFSKCLMENGFRVGCYIDVASKKKYAYKNDVQYISDSYNMLSKFKLPVLKKKAVTTLLHAEQAQMDFEYIDKNCDYPVTIIFSNLKRMDIAGMIRPFGFKEIINFCSNHDRVFLYGAGAWGRGLSFFLKRHDINPEGIIVTKRKDEFGVYEWDELNLLSNDGVIIAGGKLIWHDMLNVARKYISDENILVPKF